MYPLKKRIHLYTATYNKLPQNLEVLMPLAGDDNRIIDVWGNKINLEISVSTVSLISYGKDKKLGGIDENLDVVGIFDARIDQNVWANENTPWTQKPLE